MRLCLVVRAVRMDPGGPTVAGPIVAAGRRWALYAGRWAEVMEASVMPSGAPPVVGAPATGTLAGSPGAA